MRSFARGPNRSRTGLQKRIITVRDRLLMEKESHMKPDALPDQSTDLAEALVGVWGLTSREDYDAEGIC